MGKTTRTAFFPCNAAKQALFAVQAGVPINEALDSAYGLLDVAEELTAHLTDSGSHNREQLAHACHFLVQAAKATVEACSSALAKEVRRG